MATSSDTRASPSASPDASAESGSPAPDAAADSAGPGLRVGSPVLVLGGTPAGPQLQRFGQLVWLGSSFAVVEIENVSGRLLVTLRLLDAAGTPFGGAHIVSSSYGSMDQAPESSFAAWTGQHLAVFWTSTNRVWMRRMGADGGVLSDPVASLSDVGPHAYLVGVVPRPWGHALVIKDDRASTYKYLPYVAHVSADGAALGPSTAVLSGLDRIDTVGGVVPTPGGFAMLWDLRAASGLDSVYLSSLDEQGHPLGSQKLVYQADSALLAYFGPALASHAGGLAGVLRDIDRGIVLVAPGAASAPPAQLLLSDDASGSPVLGVLADGTTAVLHGRGEWQHTNPLPVDLVLHVAASPAWQFPEQGTVNATVSSGSCLEEYTIAPAQGAFGMLWVQGCSERRVYFARAALAP